MSSAANSEQVEALFANAKAYLMKADKDGVSVYDQLTRLMEVMLDENADHAAASDPTKFNELLGLLQTSCFVQGESTMSSQEPPRTAPAELERLAANKKLFDRPAPVVRTVIQQPDMYTTITTTTTVPVTAPAFDAVTQQNRYWAAAGYGIAEEEAFLLDRSITKLAMEKNLLDVRFVGKIFGTHANYSIVSSRRYVEEGETIYAEVNTMGKPLRRKGEVPVQAEPGFVGVNRYTFWVSADPSSAWRKLPDVTPQQINAARKVKRYFSGNLDASVTTSFPWTEAVYLRAQLARIVSSTSVAPQGALEEAQEEDEEPEEEEEVDENGVAVPPKPKEAKYRPLTVPVAEFAEGEDGADVAQYTVDRWVHAEPAIQKNGRQTKVPPKPESEEPEEEEEPVPEEEEEQNNGEEEHEEEEEEEEVEMELLAPIQGDHLYAVINIPQPPPAPADYDEDGEMDEEEADEEADHQNGEQGAAVDNTPLKPLRAEDVPDDDPTKMKIAAWRMRLSNNVSKAHRVAVVQSLLWPGAVAYAGSGGKVWGCVYFGNGLKKTDGAFTPVPAPVVQRECADVTEVADPTASTEKLVRRGEEVPEADSEEEYADEDELQEEDD